MIEYGIHLFGGPDHGRSLSTWIANRSDPLPELIAVGTCDGDRACAQMKCPGSTHLAYWTPPSEPIPRTAGLVRTYTLRDVELERTAAFAMRARGHAIYAPIDWAPRRDPKTLTPWHMPPIRG